jgi:hypothetical protein
MGGDMIFKVGEEDGDDTCNYTTQRSCVAVTSVTQRLCSPEKQGLRILGMST